MSKQKKNKKITVKRKYRSTKPRHKRDWQGLYEAYKDQYVLKREKRSGIMNTPLLSLIQFRTTYTALKNTMIEEGIKPRNIIRTLIDKQAYELSYKQAVAYKQALKEFKKAEDLKRELSGGEEGYKVEIKISATEIRKMKKNELPREFWEYMSLKYHDLRSRGLSGVEAKLEIGHTIFGSK